MSDDPLGIPGATFEDGWVDAGPGARLRLLAWRRPAGRPILFVPGWVSALEGWMDLLRVLAREHPVHYLETREKASAELTTPKVADFRIAAVAREVERATAAAGIDLAETVVVGSSLGASILLEAMKGPSFAPRAAFLIGPTCRFDIPWWGYPIMQLPAGLYRPIKYFVLWYLRTFRVDAEREPEQMRRYDQTLKVADPVRMKLSARGVAGYEIWNGLEAVRAPVAVAYASTDKLHREHDIERLLASLPRPTAVPCPSNKYMHSAELAPDIARFLAAVG